MLSEPELVALQEKFVAAREQLVPGVMLDGKILDGRNREEVCHRLGWVFKAITWEEWFKLNRASVVPPPTPTEWVLSMNIDRRHLNESQRAMAAAKALPLLEAEARKRMAAGGKKEKGGPRGPPLPVEAKGSSEKPGRARDHAAKKTGASPRSVQRAKTVLENRPDLATLIEQGKATLGKVEKTIKKEAAFKNVLVYRPPVGTYAVIVADPSWKFDDALDGSDQARGGVGYPPQTEEEICAMQVGKNIAAPDCALWLWVTNTHLMNGAATRVLSSWGFTPKALMTWRKVDSKGKDRLGTGHYLINVTEQVILAVRGKPVVNGAGVPNIFDAPRTSRHSEKPARFFEIAEKVTPCAPEARIELHAIEERKDWVTSGSEQQAKARATRSDAHDAIDRLVDSVERAALGSITWFSKRLTLPCVARGEGITARYEVYRRGRDFRWAMTHEAGEPVKGWPESPAFASLDEAKADVGECEQRRREGPTLAAQAALGAGIFAAPEAPKAKKARRLTPLAEVAGE